MSEDVRKLLAKTAFRSIDVEQLLDPNRPTWVKFDPELGYVPDNIVMRDGVDNSLTTYTYEPAGNRKVVNYPERPCRINTYGNSYTQCQQVSDDETWQERLAAHIGEPVRNFGCGGYGVYQAYRRALRMEATESGAECIILNIFHDDHVRNLDAARWIRSAWGKDAPPADEPCQLHGLPWAHLRYDVEQSKFVELPGLCKSEEDLRRLCEPEAFYEAFKDDAIVRLFTLEIGGEAEVSDVETVAEAIGVGVDLRDPAKRREEARKLRLAYGFKSTEYILEKMQPWVEKQGKKLLILLSYGRSILPGLLEGKERFGQVFIDYLKRNEIHYVDSLLKHAEDFRGLGLSGEEYTDRYYVSAAAAAVFGHYSPAGNLFFAFSAKDEIVDWLDPKSPAYA